MYLLCRAAARDPEIPTQSVGTAERQNASAMGWRHNPQRRQRSGAAGAGHPTASMRSAAKPCSAQNLRRFHRPSDEVMLEMGFEKTDCAVDPRCAAPVPCRFRGYGRSRQPRRWPMELSSACGEGPRRRSSRRNSLHEGRLARHCFQFKVGLLWRGMETKKVFSGGVAWPHPRKAAIAVARARLFAGRAAVVASRSTKESRNTTIALVR
jgi:hypothetical protein